MKKGSKKRVNKLGEANTSTRPPSKKMLGQTDATIAQNFHETIRMLDAVEQQVRDGADPLQAALSSVSVLKSLIETDLHAQANGSTRSLDQLMNAIRDLLVGGKPDLFKQCSKKGGRPSDQSIDVIKGAVVACFQILSDMGVDSPASNVSSKLKEFGIGMPIAGEKGKPIDQKKSPEITALQVNRWVRDIGEYKSTTAAGVRDQILRGWAEAQTLGLKIVPETFIRDCIKGLKSRGF